MTTAIAISIVVPIAFLAVRGQLSRLAADVRGIALQTVIVMVVLLAIAGAVAAVLLTAGGQAAEDLERQDITREAGDYSTSALCAAAGFTWTTAAPAACTR